MLYRTTSRAEQRRHIANLADAAGWRHHRAPYPSLTPDGYADGFPADVLLRDGRLVFITIGGKSGALIRSEAAWAEELAAVEVVEMHVVKAGDLYGPTGLLLGAEPAAPLESRLAQRGHAGLRPVREILDPFLADLRHRSASHTLPKRRVA